MLKILMLIVREETNEKKNVPLGELNLVLPAHWDFLCSDRSNLELMRG